MYLYKYQVCIQVQVQVQVKAKVKVEKKKPYIKSQAASIKMRMYHVSLNTLTIDNFNYMTPAHHHQLTRYQLEAH